MSITHQELRALLGCLLVKVGHENVFVSGTGMDLFLANAETEVSYIDRDDREGYLVEIVEHE